MKFADLFPDWDMCRTVAHLPWHEIIRQHLTAKPEPERQRAPERPGKVDNRFSIMRASDVITGLKAWERNAFRVESIATYSEDERFEMLKLIKRIADRLQNTPETDP